jgi:hypothetical protein
MEQQVRALVKAGKKEEAIAFIKQNAKSFEHGQVLKAADSQIAKLQKAKKTINSDQTIDRERKQAILTKIDTILRDISLAINGKID